MEVATAIQQCYRHVFYPSRQRLPGSPVDLAHAAVDIHSASETPGSGQQQIVRTLRESANQKLRLSEDPPESPGYIRDRTPLKKGQISTAALRDEFRKDPALSIHAHDSVLIRAITQGIQQGDYVYRRGELLCGPGDPMASIVIDEQSFVFTMQFAKEKSIWPRPDPDAHRRPHRRPDRQHRLSARHQRRPHRPRRRPTGTDPAATAAARRHHRRGRPQGRSHRALGKGAQSQVRPGPGAFRSPVRRHRRLPHVGQRERRERLHQAGEALRRLRHHRKAAKCSLSSPAHPATPCP